MEKIFKIEKEIYDKDILKKAIIDFEEVTKIFLEENNLIISGDTEEEIEEIFNELMNYYIGLFNQ
ncbi:hypothetical protein BKN14_02960 [Candidatus Gracilibacteria bacterium HOT-871]|nr:hypothetical protein BKN14_02960 [Candidatus Gracilibacteria bacterium HOT-871]